MRRPGMLLLAAGRAWLTRSWICLRCRLARAWRPPSRSATASRSSACGSGRRMRSRGRLALPRYWTRTYRHGTRANLVRTLDVVLDVELAQSGVTVLQAPRRAGVRRAEDVVGVLAPAEHEHDEHNDHDEDHGPDTDIHRHSFPGSARSRLSCRAVPAPSSRLSIQLPTHSAANRRRDPGRSKGWCRRRRLGPPIWDEAVGSRPCPRLLGQKAALMPGVELDRKSTRLNSSHSQISYA